MNENEEKELRNYCAFMLKEYGFQFAPTDPVLPALYVIHQEMQSSKKSNELVASQIKAATTRMNSSVYNFNAPGEGWKFKFAEALKWLFVGLSVDLLFWISLIWWSANNDLERAQTIIKTQSKIERSLLNQMKKDNEGFFFIDFKEAPSDAIENFTEYEKINSRVVRVYLGNEK